MCGLISTWQDWEHVYEADQNWMHLLKCKIKPDSKWPWQIETSSIKLNKSREVGVILIYSPLY